MMKKLLLLGCILLFATNVYALGDYHGNDVGISNSLTIGEDLTVSNNLSVANQLAVGADVTIQKDVTITGNLSVAGTLSGDAVVQVVLSQTGLLRAGTTTLPWDDTIPQITEGTEFMVASITPTLATNYLIIDAVVQLSNNTGDAAIAALFQDTTAGALAVGVADQSDGNTGTANVIVRYAMVAGTVSSTTFKIRGGVHNAGTTTFNGAAGGRKFGGEAASSLMITEIKLDDITVASN